MHETIRNAARYAWAPLALAVVLAVACDGGDEPSPSPTPEAAAATPSPALTVEPTTAPPTPSPAVTPTTPPAAASQPEWTVREEMCDNELCILLDDGLSPDAYVMAADDPELLEFEQWDLFLATDTDADGVEEVVVLHYTGGAHCCFEYLFFSSESDGIRLQDRFSLGNAGIDIVEDIDGDGVPELMTSDDRLAYFDDLSFAVSPFLPLVLCRSDEGTYVDCTPTFPQFLSDAAAGFEGRLREAVQVQAVVEERHAAALALYFSYLRLGTPEDGEAAVSSLCPECWEWLLRNTTEVDARLNVEQPFRE